MSDSMEFKFKHSKSGEIKTISLSYSEIQEKLESELYDQVGCCDCEPVGETNVVECGCEDYLEGFVLQDRIEYHTNCHDCGQFVKKSERVAKDNPHKHHALCGECLSNYDCVESDNTM